MPDLSIIILTRNNRKMLGECIASVIDHTKASSYEIIVTDNGSTDGTIELIRSKYTSIKIAEHKANLGFTRANNRGLKLAAGRYAVILNDDTYLTEDAFSAVARYMDEHQEAGICGPRLLDPDGSIQRQGSILERRKWTSQNPIEVNFVIGACMFIRMSVLGKIGLFDENLFFYNDDLDICLRARKAGFKVIYFPGASVRHYGGTTSRKTGNMMYFVEGVRGGLYFCKKHYGLAAYQAYRLLLLAATLIMAAFYGATYMFNRNKLDAWLKIAGMLITEDIVSKAPSV